MRTDTQRKLDSISRRQQLGRAAAVILAVVISAAVFILQTQPVRSERDVEATVRVATVENDPNSGKRYVQIESQLESGKIVLALGLPPMPPAQGARIVLKERVTWIGLHTYEWNGASK